MRVRVLGDLEVVVGESPDDRPVDLGGPKPRTLLALLIAAAGRPVTVEQLIDQMWGEDPPARVEASLQSHVARLRRALEPDREVRSPSGTGCARTQAATPSTSPPTRSTLGGSPRSCVRRAPSPDDAEALITEALELWRGAAYAGTAAPSLDAEATRLDELRLTAVEDLWDLRLRQGREAEAVGELEQLVREHPLRERFWALLARALYRAHRQGDALAALRRAREHLADELGVDPGPELRRLEDLVLRQDPSLDEVDPVATRAEVPAAAAPLEAPALPALPALPAQPALFGRDAPLDAGHRRASRRRGGPGPRRRGQRRARASARPASPKPWPTAHAPSGFRVGTRWLGGRGEPAAVGVAPGPDGRCSATRSVLDSGDVVDAASASFRQADAVADAVRGGPPALLVLDDVHWADAESLRLLRRLATQLDSLPLVVLVATRSAEAEIGPALAEALAALARLDPVRVELAGLAARRDRRVGQRARRRCREPPRWPARWPSAPTATPSTSPSWCGCWSARARSPPRRRRPGGPCPAGCATSYASGWPTSTRL